MLNGYKDPCLACEQLDKTNADFTENGVSAQICQNFHDNLGLNRSDSSKNCTDFHNVNDCLIGGLLDKLPSYNACDLPKLMEELMTNMMALNDLLICSDCGQWDQIDAIWAEINRIWAEIRKIWDAIHALQAAVDANNGSVAGCLAAVRKIIQNLKDSGAWNSGSDIFAGNFNAGRSIATGNINVFGGTQDGGSFIRTNNGKTENDLTGGI